MKIIGLAVTLAVTLFAANFTLAQDDGLRYIAPNKEGLSGFPVWTNWTAFNACAAALTRRGTTEDVRMFCQDGFAGIKPKVGVVDTGVQVEMLESRECREMAHIRVLGGPFKGETGCITARALTRIKPESR